MKKRMTICASFLLFVGSVFWVGCGDSGVVEIKVGDQQDSGLGTVDADGDGFGVDEGDCDDQDAAVGPGAEDVVGDGIDQNCDGHHSAPGRATASQPL